MHPAKLATPSFPGALYSPEDAALLAELTEIMEGTNAAHGGGGGGGGGGGSRVNHTEVADAVREAQRLESEARLQRLERPVERSHSGGSAEAKTLLRLPITDAAAAQPPFKATGQLIRDLGKSALMRARAYRELDIKAQCKFWLEVLPAALTPSLFKEMFASYEPATGVFSTRFSVRDAIDESGPKKTEDVALIKPIESASEEHYTLVLQWTPLRIVRADFTEGVFFDHILPEHARLFDFYTDGQYTDDPPLVTDVFRVLFPSGMRDTLVNTLHPAVKKLAVDMFRKNGIELRFTRICPNDEWDPSVAVQFLLLDGRRTLGEWQEYWRAPTAGKESFDIEVEPTMGAPAMGAPGYAEARARSGTFHTTSIAEQEAADVKAAEERAKKAKNREAEDLMAKVRGRGHVEWKDLAATGRIPNSIPTATATATATAAAPAAAAAAPTASVPVRGVALPLSPIKKPAACACDENTYCVQCSS